MCQDTTHARAGGRHGGGHQDALWTFSCSQTATFSAGVSGAAPEAASCSRRVSASTSASAHSLARSGGSSVGSVVVSLIRCMLSKWSWSLGVAGVRVGKGDGATAAWPAVASTPHALLLRLPLLCLLLALLDQGSQRQRALLVAQGL